MRRFYAIFSMRCQAASFAIFFLAYVKPVDESLRLLAFTRGIGFTRDAAAASTGFHLMMIDILLLLP